MREREREEKGEEREKQREKERKSSRDFVSPLLLLLTRPAAGAVAAMAVLLFETYFGVPNNTAVPRDYRAVSTYYGVPHVQYASVVRDGRLAWSPKCPLTADVARRGGVFDCLNHPPWTTHQLLADVIFASLLQLADMVGGEQLEQLESAVTGVTGVSGVAGATGVTGVTSISGEQRELGALEASLPPHASSSAAAPPTSALADSAARWVVRVPGMMPSHWPPLPEVCTPRSTHLASREYVNARRRPIPARPAGVRVVRGNWTLAEDRLGKPGWISTGPNGSRIEFDVDFGAVRSPAHVGAMMEIGRASCRERV